MSGITVSSARRLALTSKADNQRAVLLFAGLVTLVAALACRALPFTPFGRFQNDWLFYLDAMNRMAHGQWPHIDFMSPVGPLSFALPFWASRLWPGVQPFFGAGLLMWLAVLPPTCAIAVRIRSAPLALAFVGLVAGAILLPFTTEPSTLYEISYNGLYNRFAAALLLMLGAWLVLPGKRPRDALLVAFILVLLFFLKFTAFVIALGCVGLRGLVHRPTGRAAWRTAALVALSLLTIEAMCGLPSAYLRDILDMAGVNRGRAAYFIGSTIYKNGIAALALLALAAVLGRSLLEWAALRPRSPVRLVRALARRHLTLLDVLLLLGAAIAAESQNTGGLSLLPACAIALRPGLLDGASRLRALAAICAAVAAAAPVLEAWTQRSLGLALRRAGTYAEEPSTARLYPGVRMHRQALAGSEMYLSLWKNGAAAEAALVEGYRFEIDGTGEPPAKAAYARMIVEAADAARRAGLAGRLRHATTLDFADPFTRLLGLEPVPGLRLVLDPGRTIGDLQPSEASRYLAGVDGVFAPRCALDEKAGQIHKSFGPVLAAEFERIPLTSCWDAYVRRAGLSWQRFTPPPDQPGTESAAHPQAAWGRRAGRAGEPT